MQVSVSDATMSECTNESRFLFLGTATSIGVPVIGCSCSTCTSNHPHDRRFRSSAVIEGPWGRILIDTGPDLREQALREGLSEIDAVLYTHEHVDHVAGFDELRAFCWRRDAPLPLYGSPETLAGLERMYPWAFSMNGSQPGYVHPDPRAFAGTFEFKGLEITPIEVTHGKVRTHGFRFDYPEMKSLAYIPDVKTILPESLPFLEELDILIIDALRYEDHPTHMTVRESLAMVEKLSPKQTYFTHLSHELGWVETNSKMPQNVSLAHDQLSLKLTP